MAAAAAWFLSRRGWGHRRGVREAATSLSTNAIHEFPHISLNFTVFHVPQYTQGIKEHGQSLVAVVAMTQERRAGNKKVVFWEAV